MKRTMLAGASAIALIMTSAASAQDMPDLSGQTLSIAGPWVTADEEHFQAMVAPFV